MRALPRLLRISLYHSILLLGLSGLIIKLDQSLWVQHTPYGDQPNPSLSYALALHGAAAQIFLILAGCMLIIHILPRLAWRHNRTSGLIMLIIFMTLILTGWALYYLANEQFRSLSSTIHFWAGCFLGLVFMLHVPLKRRKEQHP